MIPLLGLCVLALGAGLAKAGPETFRIGITLALTGGGVFFLGVWSSFKRGESPDLPDEELRFPVHVFGHDVQSEIDPNGSNVDHKG